MPTLGHASCESHADDSHAAAQICNHGANLYPFMIASKTDRRHLSFFFRTGTLDTLSQALCLTRALWWTRPHKARSASLRSCAETARCDIRCAALRHSRRQMRQVQVGCRRTSRLLVLQGRHLPACLGEQRGPEPSFKHKSFPWCCPKCFQKGKAALSKHLAAPAPAPTKKRSQR